MSTKPRMGRNKMNRILDDENKMQNDTHKGAGGILAKLLRRIFFNDKVTNLMWLQLMNDFMSDMRNGIPNNKADRTSSRGNLTKEFARDQLTWKSFCRACRFLQIWKFELSIKAYYYDGRVRRHGIPVNLGTRPQVNQLLEVLHEDPQDIEDDDEEHQEE